nr:MAG TPA: hypothetical protein [Caudoviricetes sp.]
MLCEIIKLSNCKRYKYGKLFLIHKGFCTIFYIRSKFYFQNLAGEGNFIILRH